MPNNNKNKNATRKAARRATLAAAKAARNAAGVNMFTPLNGTDPVVGVKSVEIDSNPLGAEAAYGTTSLRPANMFRGIPFNGRLSPEERKHIRILGLPTGFRGRLTQEEQATANAIAAENMANIRSTKSASTPNGWGVTGKRYLYPNKYPRNIYDEGNHQQTVLATTRRLKAANDLEAEANSARTFKENFEKSADLLKQAAEIRAREGYIVSEPTPKSLKNARAVHEFAKEIHAKQIRGEKPGIFASCFGGSCPAVEPVSTRNPLSSSSYGGRSRRRTTHKMRKSRNRRRSHSSKH